MQSERNQALEKVAQFQKSLGATQQANQSVATQLTSAQQALLTHQESVNRLQKELKNANEKITNYDLRIKDLETENAQYFVSC